MKGDLVIVARRNEPKVRCKKPFYGDQIQCISVVVKW